MDNIKEEFFRKNLKNAELFFVETENTHYVISRGEKEELEKSKSFGVCLRIFENGRMGFSYMRNFFDIEKLISSAKANFFNARQWGWSMPSPQETENFDLFDDSFNKKEDEIFAELFEYEKKAKEKDPCVKDALSVSLGISKGRFLILNTNNFEKSFKKTVFTFDIVLRGEKDGEVQVGGSGNAKTYLKKLKKDEILDEAVEDLVEQFGAEAISPKKMTVLLLPKTALSFLSLISGWFCADEFLEKRVPPKIKEGEKIFSPFITIIDDGTVQELPASAPFDCEGRRVYKKEVVKEGVLKTLLKDTRTANLLNATSTANATRSYSSLPAVSHFNFYIEKGPNSKEDLLKDGEVLEITELLGLHLANPESAQFSLGAQGNLYKNGRLIKRVRGITISGDLFEFFNSVVAVADDLKFYGSGGAPSILVKGVDVSG